MDQENTTEVGQEPDQEDGKKQHMNKVVWLVAIVFVGAILYLVLFSSSISPDDISEPIPVVIIEGVVIEIGLNEGTSYISIYMGDEGVENVYVDKDDVLRINIGDIVTIKADSQLGEEGTPLDALEVINNSSAGNSTGGLSEAELRRIRNPLIRR